MKTNRVRSPRSMSQTPTSRQPGFTPQRIRRRISASWILPLLLLTLPTAVYAQFTWTTNNGTITITGYTGSGGAVTIPSTITGLPVTVIGDSAFWWSTSLTSVTIPNSVTSIGVSAFNNCSSLTSAAIGNSVTNIGTYAFYATGLTGITIPNSVTSIGDSAFQGSSVANATIGDGVTSIGAGAFAYCSSLTSVTVGNSVTSIGDDAFYDCFSLTSVYFRGNAPSAGSNVFAYESGNVTAYYLPGTTGWGTNFAGVRTALWVQVRTSVTSVGVKTNKFGFNVTGISNTMVVVEACTNLTNPVWSPVGTNTLTSGSSYFSDPQWTNYPGRVYRIRQL